MEQDTSPTIESLQEENRRLKVHVQQLENRLLNLENGNTTHKKKIRVQRPFDFTKYGKRHIALQLCYLGWNYNGLVVQRNTSNTVIQKLLDALEKARLIENQETCNLKVCGRTDKGVSGFSQVVSLIVRSQQNPPSPLDPGTAAHDGEASSPGKPELNYPFLLNNVLPKDIRAMAWAPVRVDFSARFNCLRRSYRYYFIKRDLNIQAMRTACQFLVGEHDFRNLCSHSPDVSNHVRRILHADIHPVAGGQSESPLGQYFNMWYFEVRATAFLYHQIRCMLEILFLVGQGREKPELVRDLLDVDKEPLKPQFNIASEVPLLFFEAEFDPEECKWEYSEEATVQVYKSLKSFYKEHKIKATMLEDMLLNMPGRKIFEETLMASVLKKKTNRKYTPVLARPREIREVSSSVEPAAKRRLVNVEEMESANDVAE